MKYLLLLVLLCGCSSSIEGDTFTINSINHGDENYKYKYTIIGKTDSITVQEINVRSNKEFRIGDSVEFSLKED